MLAHMSSPLIVCLGQFRVHVQMLQDQGGEGSVLQGPEQTTPMVKSVNLNSWLIWLGSRMRVRGVNCLVGSEVVWSASPRMSPECLTLNRTGIL